MGFDWTTFARDSLRHPFDPWQEWLAIHAGELLPDGRPRFRIVLVLVARQNGKTELPVILSLYWQFIDAVPLILGTSTKLDYAKESWEKAVKLAEKTAKRDDEEARVIRELIPPRRGTWRRETNGEQASKTTEDSRYKIAASNEEGGRSLTIDRLVCDELRQHHDYSAWGACEPAASAVWDSQIWAMSNAGDARSVVLNDLRADALAFVAWWQRERDAGRPHDELVELATAYAGGDYRVGIFEWSAAPGRPADDIEGLEQANPNLGTRENGGRIDPETMVANARKAMRKGGDALATFITEYTCRRVPKLDPAIDPSKWLACLDVGDMSEVRSRVALCLDVAPDQLHATLAAAAVLPDDRVRFELAAAWDGPMALDTMRRELPALLARIKPQTLGWIPNGPAAAVAAELRDRRKDGRTQWPPPGVTVAEIRGEVPAICMGLAKEVTSQRIAHSDDPLANDHVGAAERLWRGDVWVFSRKGEGHCDAAYAIAGAVHLARTLPAPIGKPRLITAPD